MQRKPIIGLNSDFRGKRRDSAAVNFLWSGYPDSLSKAGAIPVIIPLLDDVGDIMRVLDMLDGVVMIGGPDLDPQRDGFMLHPAVRTMESRREDFDRRLMDLVIMRRMPFYGIGVGMQLLNVATGGNLSLHIPEDMPDTLPHCDPSDPAHRHALEVELDSLMGRVYGEGEIRVNSMHHMAVDEVSPGFTVTARCPDGVVEAIECDRDDWFALGTQFHPESESATALDMRVFEEFVEGIINGRATGVEALGTETQSVAAEPMRLVA